MRSSSPTSRVNPGKPVQTKPGHEYRAALIFGYMDIDVEQRRRVHRAGGRATGERDGAGGPHDPGHPAVRDRDRRPLERARPTRSACRGGSSRSAATCASAAGSRSRAMPVARSSAAMHRPRFEITWECGGGVSWVEVQPPTRRRGHGAPAHAHRPRRRALGRVRARAPSGIGWELVLMVGLTQHLASGEAVDPAEAPPGQCQRGGPARSCSGAAASGAGSRSPPARRRRRPRGWRSAPSPPTRAATPADARVRRARRSGPPADPRAARRGRARRGRGGRR